MINLKSSHSGSRTGHAYAASHKTIPKEMLPIVDKPMIQYIVDEIATAGDQRNRSGYALVQECG